jgi:hypothetical protein
VQVVPLFRFGEVWDEVTRDDGNWMREGATSFTQSGESVLPKLPDLEPEDYSMYFGAYQFPNLMINLHPDCVMYYIGFPKGPTHTTVVSEYLFRPETIADPAVFKPEPVVELWDSDLEAGLGGLSARADRRRLARVHHRCYPRQDRFLYDFNERYRKEMGRALLGVWVVPALVNGLPRLGVSPEERRQQLPDVVSRRCREMLTDLWDDPRPSARG